MAFSYGFYNSMDGDRKYNAEQVSALFDGLITDGIFATIGDGFKTVAGSGMSIIVQSGRAWFNHTWSLNDGNYTITLDPADAYLSRIDAIVLEIDQNVAVRENAIKVIKGDLAGTPTRPALTNDEFLHQYPLAYVRVRASASSVTNADISIMVGQTPCPFVTGVLEAIDIDELFLKWEGEFNIWLMNTDEEFEAWWANIKETLNDNVVTNLQNQINDRVKYSDKATTEDVEGAKDVRKWVNPAQAHKIASGLSITELAKPGDILSSAVDLEKATDGKFVACDGRTVPILSVMDDYSLVDPAWGPAYVMDLRNSINYKPETTMARDIAVVKDLVYSKGSTATSVSIAGASSDTPTGSIFTVPSTSTIYGAGETAYIFNNKVLNEIGPNGELIPLSGTLTAPTMMVTTTPNVYSEKTYDVVLDRPNSSGSGFYILAINKKTKSVTEYNTTTSDIPVTYSPMAGHRNDKIYFNAYRTNAELTSTTNQQELIEFDLATGNIKRHKLPMVSSSTGALFTIGKAYVYEDTVAYPCYEYRPSSTYAAADAMLKIHIYVYKFTDSGVGSTINHVELDLSSATAQTPGFASFAEVFQWVHFYKNYFVFYSQFNSRSSSTATTGGISYCAAINLDSQELTELHNLYQVNHGVVTSWKMCSPTDGHCLIFRGDRTSDNATEYIIFCDFKLFGVEKIGKYGPSYPSVGMAASDNGVFAAAVGLSRTTSQCYYTNDPTKMCLPSIDGGYLRLKD